MAKTYTIKFTALELYCLRSMASQVAEHGDIMEQEFPHARTRVAAERAYEKLWTKQRSPSTRTTKGGAERGGSSES